MKDAPIANPSRDTSPSCPEPVFPSGLLSLGEQSVEPGWIDYNGHMNVSYYTLAFDRAFDDFLENWIGIGESFVSRSRLGPMALQTQICYLGELLEGERFHVDVHLLDHDEKRIHFFGTMISARTGQPAATYESLGINVDLETRRPAPYPDWTLARLASMRKAQASLPRPKQAGQPLGIRRRG
ncbi:thioesterase [Pikeienuella piscinae]|uniref:Thioesterase n=1 Tax=Pikeienuella piscinae TaxID=2748098 RepID=A0A7M3T6N0_9RHOB|nr:thioesterase family protein [Pikeienuella piscinae]QIE57661.1 thioesterase [Pikeienuella piscinae]